MTKNFLFSSAFASCLSASLLLAVTAYCEPKTGTDWHIESTDQPGRQIELSLDEGTWMSVDLSPDGQTIAFDLLGDIYLLPASGGTATAVHSGPAMQKMPRFSPDGRYLSFISDRSGSDNIWISEIEGAGLRQISHETTHVLTGPAWAPDGKSIAAARMFDTADRLHASEIVSYKLAGAPPDILVAAPENGEHVHDAAFSPDGSTLYYTEKISPPTKSVVYIDANHINYAIKSRHLETGEITKLVSGFGSATSPTVSPDGERIAFIRRVKDKTVLFTLNLQTGEQTPVFDGLDRDGQSDFIGQGTYYPQFGWFPGGKHILIWAGGQLHRINVATGDAEEIAFNARSVHRLVDPVRRGQELAPETMRAKAFRNLAVSPSSTDYAFIALGQLWLADQEGAVRQLTQGAVRISDPAFSPDGNEIAYVEWGDTEGSRLRLASLSGEARTTLITSNGIIAEPRFSADGNTIVYRIAKGDLCLGGHKADPGIYILPLNGGAPRLVSETGKNPLLSKDGQRLFFTTEDYEDDALITRLQSVRLNGGKPTVHTETISADTYALNVSPDLKWLAYRHEQNYYVAPFDPDAETVVLRADNGKRISPFGGYDLAWAADGGKAFWLLGPQIYEFSPAVPGSTGQIAVEPEVIVTPDRPTGRLALINGRLLTMAGDEAIEKGTVIINGNKIEAVGPVSDIVIPPDAKVLDLNGKTLMPGMVDMHGHLDLCYYTNSGLIPQKHPSRYAALAYGVTTNYDPYTSELPTYMMAEMVKAGSMLGPRAIDVGAVAYGRKRKSDGVFLPLRTYDDARQFMQRKAALGGTIIKSYRQTMRRQRQQLLKAGREFGIMVDVEGESHFYNNLTMILDGHVNLQHNMPLATLYDDVIQLAAQSNVTHTPTLIVMFGELMGENYLYQTIRTWDDPKAKTFLQSTTSGYSPLGTPYGAPLHVRGMTCIHAAKEIWDIGFRSVSRTMNKLDQAGMVINAGSHGQAAGLAMHWELVLLAEGGMPPERVLRAATLNGAKTLGLEDQIGSLEAGKLADIIVLDKNPMESIHNTNSVRYTIMNGRVYDAHTMNEVLPRQAPRERFFWETGRTLNGIDWKPVWAEH